MAQDDDFRPAGQGVIVRNVNLRTLPTIRSRSIKILSPPEEYRLVNPEPRNGFYRVVMRSGLQGWVWKENIRIESQPVPSGGMTIALARSSPCHTTLDECPEAGCAENDDAQEALNRMKRQIPEASIPILLTLADFRNLQEETNTLFWQGTKLSPEERLRLKDFTIPDGSVSEGSLVAFSGYIPIDYRPRFNTGESVNCNLTGSPNNDIHISVGRSSKNTEYKGFVVEMIPQGRPDEWNLAKLRKVRDQRRRVLVIGQLFYDNKHVVNSDPNDPIGGQPKRMSLWEIHPITDFRVCTRAENRCNPKVMSEWKPLVEF